MKPVLIDITELMARCGLGTIPTGIQRVTLAYIEHYCDRARALIGVSRFCVVLPKDISSQVFHLLLTRPKHFFFKASMLIVKGIMRKSNKHEVRGGLIFNVSNYGVEFDRYHVLLQKLQVTPLFMIYDLLPITHGECFWPVERKTCLAKLKRVGNAHGVITPSQTVLNDLTTYMTKDGKKLPPAISAPLAPGRSKSIKPGERPITQPYFVILGTIEPRKNVWFLLQVWRRLIEILGENAPHLVVIGQKSWRCMHVMDMLNRCDTLSNFVIRRAASDGEIVTYLHHAQALIFPSLGEGFGMPLVEALALGLPVIASDLEVFREIAGDTPEYVDPLDGKQWLKMIAAYTNSDNELRMNQLQRMRQFKVPAWRDHFAKVDQFVEQLSMSY